MTLRDRLNADLNGVFVLDREIGGGGMSSVFVAQERALGRDVVLKVLPPELAAEVSEERFRREVLLAARLQHPHIVPILSAGEANGLLYYTMPLVEGETLRARLAREGELPVADAIRILSCVADAMAYAHSHGVAHRDIKPENILLTGQHAVVTDFGIAKALGDAASGPALTATGIAIGTAAYMAPEQVAADPAADHRVDIYALGIVAYEMLTGAAPFAGRPQQVAAAHLTQQPEAITTRRAAVPPALVALVMSALEKRPADRPQSAQAISNELAQLAVSGGQPAMSAGTRRTRRLTIAASVLVLAVGSVATAIMIKGDRSGTAAVSGKRVVVAALTNETGDQSLASFGKMAADWVTQGLQETGFIDVVDSRNVLQATRQLSNAQTPVSDALAKQTGAAIVIVGSYYVENDSLIVRANIVDAADGKVLRTVSVPRVSRQSPTIALEALRDQVLAALAPLVDPRLATWETSLKPPSYAAYRVYMDGLEAYVAQNNNVSYDSSAMQFTHAVQLDTTFQTARLWQAFTLFLAGWTSHARFLPPADSVLGVLRLHHDELSPSDRRFYNWIVTLRQNDMQGTYVTAKEMMKASPGSAHAIWESALAAARTNRPQEALTLLDQPVLSRARQGSLSMKPYADWKAFAEHMLGDYDAELRIGVTYSSPDVQSRANAALGNGNAALEQMRPIVESESGTLWGKLLRARIVIEELVSHGQPAAARTLAASAVEAYRANKLPEREILARVNVAGILYAVGRVREAGTLLDEIASLDSAAYPRINVECYARGLMAVIAARTGDRAKAQRIASELAGRRFDVVFSPLNSYWRARIAAAMGEDDNAVALLRRALADGFLPLPGVAGGFLHADPDLGRLLAKPEVRELARPKG